MRRYAIYDAYRGKESLERIVTICFDPTPVADFQVKIVLPETFPYEAFANGLHAFSLLNEELSWYQESWDIAGTSILWVKVPDAGTTAVRLRGRGQVASDGSSVFMLFDDFEGSALNTEVWTPTDATKFAVSASKLHVLYASSYPTINTVAYFSGPLVVEAKLTNIVGGSPSYNQFLMDLRSPLNGVQMYGEGTYDRSLSINGVATFKSGTDKGFNTEPTIYGIHLADASIRVVAERVHGFDDIFYGQLALATPRRLCLCGSHNATYDIEWVRVRQFSSSDIIGTPCV